MVNLYCLCLIGVVSAKCFKAKISQFFVILDSLMMLRTRSSDA